MLLQYAFDSFPYGLYAHEELQIWASFSPHSSVCDLPSSYNRLDFGSCSMCTLPVFLSFLPRAMLVFASRISRRKSNSLTSATKDCTFSVATQFVQPHAAVSGHEQQLECEARIAFTFK